MATAAAPSALAPSDASSRAGARAAVRTRATRRSYSRSQSAPAGFASAGCSAESDAPPRPHHIRAAASALTGAATKGPASGTRPNAAAPSADEADQAASEVARIFAALPGSTGAST